MLWQVDAAGRQRCRQDKRQTGNEPFCPPALQVFSGFPGAQSLQEKQRVKQPRRQEEVSGGVDLKQRNKRLVTGLVNPTDLIEGSVEVSERGFTLQRGQHCVIPFRPE